MSNSKDAIINMMQEAYRRSEGRYQGFFGLPNYVIKNVRLPEAEQNIWEMPGAGLSYNVAQKAMADEIQKLRFSDAYAAAEARIWAHVAEECAKKIEANWSETCGADYGMASDEQRRAMGERNRMIVWCAEQIRAIAPRMDASKEKIGESAP